MKKIIFVVLSGAVVAQVWGMISWMALGWHGMDFRSFSNHRGLARVIEREANGPGIYMVPNYDEAAHKDEALMKQWHDEAAQGPFAFLVVRPDGIPNAMGPMMAIGFVINLLVAWALFWMVGCMSKASRQKQILFMGVAATAGAFYVHMANWNWWYFPVSYTAVGIIDQFITWAMAGFVMLKVADRMGSKRKRA